MGNHPTNTGKAVFVFIPFSSTKHICKGKINSANAPPLHMAFRSISLPFLQAYSTPLALFHTLHSSSRQFLWLCRSYPPFQSLVITPFPITYHFINVTLSGVEVSLEIILECLINRSIHSVLPLSFHSLQPLKATHCQ